MLHIAASRGDIVARRDAHSPSTPTKCPSPQYVPQLPLLFLLLLVPSRRKLTNWGEEGWLGNWGKQMGGQLAGQGSGGRGALVGSKSRIRSCGRLQIMATPLCGRMALDRPQNFADRPWIRQEKNLHLPHERGSSSCGGELPTKALCACLKPFQGVESFVIILERVRRIFFSGHGESLCVHVAHKAGKEGGSKVWKRV